MIFSGAAWNGFGQAQLLIPLESSGRAKNRLSGHSDAVQIAAQEVAECAVRPRALKNRHLAVVIDRLG